MTSQANPVDKGNGRGHSFDDDAVCTDCGFDGAEWAHWRHHTYEGKAHPEAKPPLCTHTGRDIDVWPPREIFDIEDHTPEDEDDHVDQ